MTKEEKRKLYTDTNEKRREVLEKLPPEVQRTLMDRMEIKKYFLALPSLYIYEGNQEFEDLSKKSQDFLIKSGIDTQRGYGDYFHSIKMMAYYEASFSEDYFMDDEIEKIGSDKNIDMEGLDEEAAIIEFLNNNNEGFKKISVNRFLIEREIENHEQLTNYWKEQISNSVRIYKASLIESPILNSGNTLLFDTIFRQRNKIWLEKFQKAHENQEYENIFLTGGLLHFTGPFNLLDMLEEREFSVTAMTCSDLEKERDYLRVLKDLFSIFSTDI